MNWKTFVIVIFSVCILFGCASVGRTMVPYTRDKSSMPSPTIQQLFGDAAAQAVEQAVKPAEWKTAIRGKKVSVEIQGVLPMECGDFPGFIRAAVEAECAKAGAIVLTSKPTGLVVASQNVTTDIQPDYRIIVNLGRSGIDISKKAELDTVTLLLQIVTLAASGAMGGLLAEPIGAYAAIPAGLGFSSGILWLVLSPPIKNTYILKSTVAMNIYLLPQSLAGSYSDLNGTGTKEISIPATPDSPYVLVTDTLF
jgi:hypothetical protein